jgi:hypothetical protein
MGQPSSQCEHLMPMNKSDEMVLNVDGFVPVDPALGLRERAQWFVASRQWATPSIYYGDQPEPADPEFPRGWWRRLMGA